MHRAPYFLLVTALRSDLSYTWRKPSQEVVFVAGIGLIGPTLYWHIPGAIVAGGLFLLLWARYRRGGLEKKATDVNRFRLHRYRVSSIANSSSPCQNRDN